MQQKLLRLVRSEADSEAQAEQIVTTLTSDAAVPATPAHTHDHEHAHPHEHDHADGHKHLHHHENTKYVQNRLARASGHLQHVRAMVDSGEDCSDVLMQLSAVIGALQSIAKVILKDHLDHCVVDAVQSGDTQTLDDFKKAIDRYIR